MRSRRAFVALLVLLVCPAGGPPAARSPSVVDLLDRYAAGRFDAVVQDLSQLTEFDGILKQIRRDGPAWIARGGPAERERRELTAATFALEAARVGSWHEWKWIQRQPQMCSGQDCPPPPNLLYWQAPPLLIEWGCDLFAADATPRPVERWWQLAALAVTQRSEDVHFLIGDPYIGQGFHTPEIINIRDEIKHLDHTMERFPKEMRFVLAQGVARDQYFPEDAVQAYSALENDPDVGAEALVRLGAMHMPGRRSNYASPGGPAARGVNVAHALRSFERAERMTRDPYVIYLARYFRARTLDHPARAREAEAAYRGASAAIPHAQSATIGLASLLFRDGRRTEAERLVAGMLAAAPRPFDPWRAYVHADDRFWPYLIAKLRAEIAPRITQAAAGRSTGDNP